MLRVKFAAERRDAASCDGLTAAAAQSALPGMEVEGAEWSSIQLHEAAISERLQTVLDLKKIIIIIIRKKNLFKFKWNAFDYLQN